MTTSQKTDFFNFRFVQLYYVIIVKNVSSL
jgi:hypothetical protein